VGDRWNYPFNGTPGTKDIAGLFDSAVPGFGFNYRDGEAVIQFAPQLPQEYSGTSFTVSAARLEVWNVGNAQWDPTTTTLDLFAAGFSPAYKELASDASAGTVWTETSPYIGGGAAPLAVARDPFPRDKADNSHAEENPSATPWALASHPDYTSATQTTAPFKCTFDLPVNDAAVQQELREDLLRGVSTWVLSTNYLASGQGDTAYPAIYLHGAAAPPAPAAIPVLHLEIAPANAAVADWSMYY
jgi:hypothetical protein